MNTLWHQQHAEDAAPFLCDCMQATMTGQATAGVGATVPHQGVEEATAVAAHLYGDAATAGTLPPCFCFCTGYPYTC